MSEKFDLAGIDLPPTYFRKCRVCGRGYGSYGGGDPSEDLNEMVMELIQFPDKHGGLPMYVS